MMMMMMMMMMMNVSPTTLIVLLNSKSRTVYWLHFYKNSALNPEFINTIRLFLIVIRSV
jgi:hypothetical protein